jgi:BirA family biotin operon repressor/biotin-[acetyl-CoA-carboxylase] ligase
MSMAEDGAAHGTVVIAETQHAGRGRFGRVWYSPRGGIWLSILIKPQGSLSLTDSLPLIGALGTAKALRQTEGVKAMVRWPNDVVVDSRKIAGVIVESKSKGNELTYGTLGLGVNANFYTDDIETIRDSSTSLMTLVGRPINREDLIAAILSEVELIYESARASAGAEVMALLRALDGSKEKRVKVRTAQRKLEGVFDDYEGLARVRIVTKGGPELVETSTVISVDYESN